MAKFPAAGHNTEFCPSHRDVGARDDPRARPCCLARARAEGTKLGRPKVSGETEQAIRERLAAGTAMLKVAAQLGVGTGMVQRVKREMGRRR